MENKEIITSEERVKFDKAYKTYKDFRGNKIVKKNRAPYRQIIERCEKDYIKKELGEQWKNSVETYGYRNKLTLPRRNALYKSLMKWKKGKVH